MKFLIFIFVYLSTIFSFAQNLPNQMEFTIGNDFHRVNVPYVSITVCIPGTQTCKTIDHIKLDTGSEGLRIFKSALSDLNLPIEHDNRGNDLALCANFAGNDGDWGPIATADVMLGGETAKNAKIQIIDSNYPRFGVPCLPEAGDRRNGIIGIDTAIGAPNGKHYFSCGSNSCSSVPLNPEQQPINPLTYLDEDNNGFIMRTPAVSSGQQSLTGLVIFGVGTRANNQPPSTLTSCHVQENDFFKLKYNGATYWTKMDSGTNSYNLPSAVTNVPTCPYSSVYLCPNPSANFTVDLINADGSECSSLNFTISSNNLSSTNGPWVVPELGERWGGSAANMFLLGMPFFFGRDVYYVLNSQSSPLGDGPLVGF